MRYFRYRFLNGLRYELFLTFTRQKLTLVHFLTVLLPVGLIAFAIALERSMARFFVAVALAIALGLVCNWVIPRAIWKLLQAALDRGWFVRTGHVPSEPAMTSSEYSERYALWRRADLRQTVGYVAMTLTVCLTGLIAGDSRWLPEFLGSVILYSSGFALLVITFHSVRLRRHVAAKYGLVCPTCSAMIANQTLAMADDGFIECTNCGRRLIFADHEAATVPPNEECR